MDSTSSVLQTKGRGWKKWKLAAFSTKLIEGKISGIASQALAWACRLRKRSSKHMGEPYMPLAVRDKDRSSPSACQHNGDGIFLSIRRKHDGQPTFY